MRTYRLVFKASARREWDTLGSSIREQFKKKLAERLRNPHVRSAKLGDLPDCYKIKLKAAGYRLVYRVAEDRVVVMVLAIGRRERNLVYRTAAGRLD